MNEQQAQPWWERAVFYQVYPRSFRDTSGNGIGDLGGVRSQLDYLAELGVDGLWLSPIYPSPMADHGYDVADYCDVDPLFGSLEELDQLVAEAHARAIKVLLDWVPCHTSDQHPWFREARSSRDNPKRDWYIFCDGSPETPPNEWRSTFPLDAPPGSAWTWDDVAGAWYYHRFTSAQPDVDLSNTDARAALYDTVRFWLDRGVDGFRIDVVQHLGKDRSLVTAPPVDPPTGEHPGPTNPERTHEYLRELRTLFDSYAPAAGDAGQARLALGEVYILDVEQAASYVGNGPGGDELHLGFNFLPLFLPWRAADWRDHLTEVERAYGARGAWPTWAFGSHDIPRQRTRLGREARARAMAVMLLGLRGTPFLYAGEELGLSDADVPPHLAQDPAGFRDGCRAPIPWDGSAGHGWAGEEPWLPWPPEAEDAHAAAQMIDPGSVYGLYRRLLRTRRGSAALRAGEQVVRPVAETEPVDSDEAQVVSWVRRALADSESDGGLLAGSGRSGAGGGGGIADERLVAVNFADRSVPFAAGAPVAGSGWLVEVASDGAGEGASFTGTLGAEQAVVLRPE